MLMFDHEQKIMIDRIVKELEENNFAIFAGAGLSAPAGYVNWKELLRPLSIELNLDIDKLKEIYPEEYKGVVKNVLEADLLLYHKTLTDYREKYSK